MKENKYCLKLFATLDKLFYNEIVIFMGLVKRWESGSTKNY